MDWTTFFTYILFIFMGMFYTHSGQAFARGEAKSGILWILGGVFLGGVATLINL